MRSRVAGLGVPYGLERSCKLVAGKVFGDRFLQMLGRPPIRYLTEWRLNLASGLLRTTELGVTQAFPTPTYQIDRGIFEAFLARHAAELGAHFIDRAVVRHIDLDAGTLHRVRYECEGAEHLSQGVIARDESA